MRIINYKFVASGIATGLKANLYGFTPSRINPINYGSEEKPTFDSENIIARNVFSFGRQYNVPLMFRIPTKPKEEWLTIDEAIVSVSQTKEIVRTSLVGLSGTIKEYIADGDFEFNIKIGIVATNESGNIVDQYPYEGIIALTEYLDFNDAIEVRSDFIDAVTGVTKIVISSYSITQSTESNRQEVSITALSDVEYDILTEEY